MILRKNDCKLTVSYFSGCGDWCHWLCTVNDCNSNLITAIWLYKGCTLAVSICSAHIKHLLLVTFCDTLAGIKVSFWADGTERTDERTNGWTDGQTVVEVEIVI